MRRVTGYSGPTWPSDLRGRSRSGQNMERWGLGDGITLSSSTSLSWVLMPKPTPIGAGGRILFTPFIMPFWPRDMERLRPAQDSFPELLGRILVDSRGELTGLYI